jgi:hypothetical protein
LPQRTAVASAEYKLVLHPTRLWNSGAADMRLAGRTLATIVGCRTRAATLR